MNRVFLNLGQFKIYWYSVLILVGVLIGIYLILNEAKRQNIDKGLISDLCFNVIPVSIIGARLYYVIFNFSLFKDDLLSIFRIWEGGIAIYGGVLVGILFIYFYTKKKKQDTMKILDIFAPSLVLAQGIGRWGNFFNQEAYGGVTTRIFLEKMHIPNFIINNMYIEGAYHEPTFLYESLICLMIFIILMLIRYLSKKNKVGNITFTYFILYGTGRYFIEGMRLDSLYIGSFRVSQIVSIILIIVGIFGLIKTKNNYLYNEPKKSTK